MDTSPLFKPHTGNANDDGPWVVGDRKEQDSPLFHRSVFIKYSTHAEGDQCAEPHAKGKTKVNFSVLVSGGPFTHEFKKLGSDVPIAGDFALERPGDYVIYDGANVTHTWKAVGKSIVVTIQFDKKEEISRDQLAEWPPGTPEMKA